MLCECTNGSRMLVSRPDRRDLRPDSAVRPGVATSPRAWISHRPDLPADRPNRARRRYRRAAMLRRRALVGAVRRAVGDDRSDRGRRVVARPVFVRTHLGDANRDLLRVRRRSRACAAGRRSAATVACCRVSRCSGGARDRSRWDAGRAGRRPAAMGFPRARARITLAKGGERKLKRGGAGEPRCYWPSQRSRHCRIATACSRRPSGSSGTGPKPQVRASNRSRVSRNAGRARSD